MVSNRYMEAEEPAGQGKYDEEPSKGKGKSKSKGKSKGKHLG